MIASDEERDLPVDQRADHKHPHQRHRRLDHRREGHDDVSERVRLIVDAGHQLAAPLAVVEGEGQLLHVLQEVTPEIEDHVLLDLRTQVLLSHGGCVTQRRRS